MGKIIGLVLLALAAIGAMVGGGWHALRAFSNQIPTEITCGELIDQKPEQIYLTVTDCLVDIEGVSYIRNGSDPDDTEIAVVPLVAPDQPRTSVHVVMTTTDSTWIKHANVLPNLWTEQEKAHFVETNGLNKPLTFRGRVTDNDNIERLFLGLSKNYLVLEHNKKPNWMIGSTVFLGGLAVLGFGIFSVLHSRRRRKRVEMATRV